MTNSNLSSNGTSARHRMFSLIWPGALAGQAIYCAAKLGVADLIAQGVDDIECLAATTKTHPQALRRLLRALCSLGIMTESCSGRFALTDMGQTLRAGDPSGVHPWAVMLGAPFVWRPWGRLLETIQTGEAAFARIFGRSFEELMVLSPEDAEIYHAAMNAASSSTVPTIVKSYDFSRFRVLVDVGGGMGALLLGILESHHHLQGILFDRPSVVSSVSWARAGALTDRCQVVGGDFFESVPTGGDVYLLKSIIHSHNDEDAIRILRNVRRAMRVDGKVLMVDVVLQPLNEPSPQKALMDLMMLALVSGHERTEAEFASLLNQSGFHLSRVVHTGCGSSIVEGTPA